MPRLEPKIQASLDLLQEDFELIYHSGRFTESTFRQRVKEAHLKKFNQHSVPVSSCGAGLFATYRTVFFPGSKVVVPNNTFFATGAMLSEAGCTLVLADVSQKDFCLSLETLQEAITPDVRGVVLTHVGGGIAHDYEAIAKFCDNNAITLIEDAAHAYGASNENGYTAGDLGDVAVFSFYPTKAMPAGEGGLVVSKDTELLDRIETFCNYGKSINDKGQVEYTGYGFNFRMDEWTAAVVARQIEVLDLILLSRQQDRNRLANLFPQLVTYPHKSNSNCYKFITVEDPSIVRRTGKVYRSEDQLHQSVGIMDVEFPNCDWIAKAHMCLPVGLNMYSGMSDEEILRWLRKDV